VVPAFPGADLQQRTAAPQSGAPAVRSSAPGRCPRRPKAVRQHWAAAPQGGAPGAPGLCPCSVLQRPGALLPAPHSGAQAECHRAPSHPRAVPLAPEFGAPAASRGASERSPRRPGAVPQQRAAVPPSGAPRCLRSVPQQRVAAPLSGAPGARERCSSSWGQHPRAVPPAPQSGGPAASISAPSGAPEAPGRCPGSV
jgi:hypothetical protein